MKNSETCKTYELRDGEEINGILNRSTGNKKIVLFVHGLSGNPGEPAFYSAKRSFPARGYDTLRLFLYSPDKKSKHFSWNTSLQQHRKDVEDVIKKLEKTYRKIFLVGHSIGGPVIYQSQYINNCKKVPAVALLEPTIAPVGVRKDFTFNKSLDGYVSCGLVVSKSFVEEMSGLTITSISEFNKPFLLALNTKGQLKKNWKNAEKHISAPHTKLLLANSGHDFSVDEHVDELLKETLKFFATYK